MAAPGAYPTQLGKNCKIFNVKAYTAANTGDLTCDEVDMLGWDGVIFVAKIGTANVANGIYLQQDTVTGMGSAADLEDSENLSDGTETVLMSEVYRPQEQFVRAVVDRTVSTTVEGVWAICYKGQRKKPFDHDARSDTSYELLVEPDEGTK